MEQKTYWELGKLLETTAKSLLSFPENIVIVVKEDVDFQVKEVEYAIEKLALIYKQFCDAVSAHQDQMIKQADKSYDEISKVVRELDKRFKALPSIETTKIPYNLDEMFKVMERLSYYSDSDFERLLKVIKVFAEEPKNE